MDRAFRDAKQFGWSKAPIVEMLIPSTVDDSLAPPGQHVASLFYQHFAPEFAWDTHREPAADTIIDTVQAYAPGFKPSVLGRMVLSRPDLERQFGSVGVDHKPGNNYMDKHWSRNHHRATAP